MRQIRAMIEEYRGVPQGSLRVDGKYVIPNRLPLSLTDQERKICEEFTEVIRRNTKQEDE